MSTNNPPAFPFPTEATQRGHDGTREGEPGMSLRDYFAAKALQGQLADSLIRPHGFDELCENCYKWADAMLKAREK